MGAVLAIVFVGTAAGAAPKKTLATPTVYWGAHIGNLFGLGTEAPWNMANAAAFAGSVGKRPSLIEFGIWWYGCDSGQCKLNDFPAKQLGSIRRYGAIPLLSWASGNEASADQSSFTLASIVDGTYDAYILRWARAARAWGHPFFLRFDWEMNLPGIWPWSPGVNGNTASEYIPAWRHVHDIFQRAGATNVTWVWCANVSYPGAPAVSTFYPGARYVDWASLDGYNWGSNPNAVPGSHWMPFVDLFKSSYLTLTRHVAVGKPLLISETASTESGGSKARWISNAYAAIPGQFPAIKGVVYFDRDNGDRMDWPLSSSPSALAAFRAAIASTSYAPARFATISGGTIAPLPPRGR